LNKFTVTVDLMVNGMHRCYNAVVVNSGFMKSASGA